jgi:hypothetical protein
MCVRVELQALLQSFKLVCNTVSQRQVSDRDYKLNVCYKSFASLVLCRASKATC